MGRPTVIKVGDRNGRLVVTGVKTFGAGRNAIAVCRCDCGNESEVRYQNLKKMKSCGCSQHDASTRKPRGRTTYKSKPPGSAMMHSLFCTYRSHAKRRGIDFALTPEEFKEIVSSHCHYCGAEPTEKMAFRKTGEPMYNGPAIANGIDRLENTEGYTGNNSVACCTECNLSKHVRSRDAFIKHCMRVAARLSAQMSE